jgi:Uma2 family endonuclease
MTAVPEWMIGGLTGAEYDALPEDICRQIEIIDGSVVVNPRPLRPHQRVVRKLANVLESVCGPDLAVDTEVDLWLRDIPLLLRSPDVVVYDAALPHSARLRPEHCILVVEVMSPGSVTADQTDKPAEYARAGIEHFWRVENCADAGKLTVYRFRLDQTTRTYASLGASTGKLVATDPLEVSIALAELL